MALQTFEITIANYNLVDYGFTHFTIPQGDIDPDPGLLTVDDNKVSGWIEITFYGGGAMELFVQTGDAGTDPGAVLDTSTFTQLLLENEDGTTAFDLGDFDIGEGDLSYSFSSVAGDFTSFWFPASLKTSNFWGADELGNTYTCSWDDGVPGGETTDIIRLAFDEDSSTTGIVSVDMDGWNVDELMLISVSAQHQLIRNFSISVTDELAIKRARGLKIMPDPYASHQWFYRVIKTAGDKTITAITDRFNFPRQTEPIPMGLQVWRIGGAAIKAPVVHTITNVGNTEGQSSFPIRFDMDGDKRYGASTGQLTKGAFFSVMHNTNVNPGTIGNGGFTPEVVPDFGSPDSFTDISYDMLIDSGAFSGFSFVWNFGVPTTYLASVIQLRSEVTYQRHLRKGRQTIAIPQGKFSATHFQPVTGGTARNTGVK